MRRSQKMFLWVLLFLSLHAYAVEPAPSTAPANSTASTAEVSTSAAAGNSDNNQNITFNSGSPLGKSTLVTTGSANLGGFSGSFSSDYCGSTVQAGVGGLGFGVSGGMARIDNTCVMLRTFERTQQAASALMQIDPVGSEKLRRASIAILAEIDPKIKLIYEKHGLLDANGIGLVGKVYDVNAKTNVSADVKPNNEPKMDSTPNADAKVGGSHSQGKPKNELRVEKIPDVNAKVGGSHSQGKPNIEPQMEVIALPVTPVISSSESSDNPKPQSLWERLKSCVKAQFSGTP